MQWKTHHQSKCNLVKCNDLVFNSIDNYIGIAKRDKKFTITFIKIGTLLFGILD